MFTHNGKISNRQVTLLLVLQMFNMTILILPKIGTDYVGRNAYILPLLAIVLGAVYAICITALTKMFPGDTMIEFLPKIVPSFIGYIIVLIFGIKVIVTTGLELRMFGEMIGQIMLPKTPLPVIILVMLLTTAYLVKSGIEATGRMAEILVYFVFIPLAVVFFKILISCDYKEVMPFLRTQVQDVGIGTYFISLSFAPIEFMLLMTGLMARPRGARGAIIRAVIVIAIIESIILLLTICGIGLGEVEKQVWPVLTLMQSIENNGRIMESQEILMMTGWIMSVFVYISSGIYFTSFMASRTLKLKRENIFVLPVVPIVYFVAMYAGNLVEAYNSYINFQRYVGVLFLVPVPLILLLIAKVRRIKQDE